MIPNLSTGLGAVPTIAVVQGAAILGATVIGALAVGFVGGIVLVAVFGG